MTAETVTPAIPSKEALDRLEVLSGHLEHLLCEAFYYSEDAASRCTGEAKHYAGRASTSITIAQDFRMEMVQLIEQLQGYGKRAEA